MLSMKEEKVREFVDRIMVVVYKIILLRKDLKKQRVIKKVLISLPERFEHEIASLADTKDMTTFSLTELMNSLHALKQSQNMRKV